MKKVLIVDIDGRTWEYLYDEVSWSFDEDNLFVRTVAKRETRLILKLSLFAYLEVVE